MTILDGSGSAGLLAGLLFMKSSIVHTIPLRQRAEVTNGYGYIVLYHRSDIMPCNKIDKPLVV